MAVDIFFHGAAGVVTGSCMELRSSTHRVLIDCGLFQGSRSLEALNYEPLPFDPAAIDAVVLTHAHLDHSGRLGLLMHQGFTGKIWCTPPNRQLLGPLLTDAANLQAADAARRNERPDRAGLPPFEPLYDFSDVDRVIAHLQAVDYARLAEPVPGVKLRFWDAHHILGAATVELEIDGQALLFSGDIGASAAADEGPRPPATGWDHVVCEATYGDRDRTTVTPDVRRETLAKAVDDGLGRGGNLVIPSFALERTQVILEDIVALFDAGRLAEVDVYIDAPLADKITEAYRRFDAHPRGTRSPFDHPRIKFTRSVAESRTLNHVTGAVILAGSGMCTGGRVRYHLLRNLPRPDSTILFVGYQAHGTLGAVIKSGAKAVRISGSDVPVRARIADIDVYSGHADHAALLRWLDRRQPISGSLFLDHGEEPALARLASDARTVLKIPDVVVPELGQGFALAPRTPAVATTAARTDTRSLVRDDWSSRLSAFRTTLDQRLRSLTTDDDRNAALAAMNAALAPVTK